MYAFNTYMFNIKDSMNASKTPPNIWELPSGTVIRADHGLYSHVALLGDGSLHGERTVVEFSSASGGFAELPFSEFSKNRRVTVDGYLGALSPSEVMQRASLKRGQTYSLTNFNCEHFVRYAHGLQIESPQLQKWTMFGIIAYLAFS
jgi:hypothetical protein